MGSTRSAVLLLSSLLAAGSAAAAGGPRMAAVVALACLALAVARSGEARGEMAGYRETATRGAR
jgi:pheromone shutdown protein TraB